MSNTNWSNRDDAVVPWISLRKNNDRTQYVSSSDYYSRENLTRRCKILSLLAQREHSTNQCQRNQISNGMVEAGAWNPRRLQNMILAVGPGTPASCVISTTTAEQSSSSSGEEDSDMFDDDSEDDGGNAAESNNDDSNSGASVAVNDIDDSSNEGAEQDSDHTQQDNTSSVSSTAREEAETEIARQLSAQITQSPAGDQQEDTNSENENDDQSTGRRRSHWERRQQSILDALSGVGNEDINNEEDDSNEDDSPDDDSSEGDHANANELLLDHLESLARRRERRMNAEGLLSSPARDRGVYNETTNMYEREVSRSMKHGGCINTVSWLDCGWKISTVSHEDSNPYQMQRYLVGDGFLSSSDSYSANNYLPEVSPYSTPQHKRGLAAPLDPNECPTQLVSSGDDHLVKFWDVAASMGSTSPLSGGSATVTPFSSQRMPIKACSELVDNWRNSSTTIGSHKRYLPGVVHPLVTLPSGHRGNVFHVTPVPHSLGKIATCAADGFLRLMDIEIHSKSSPQARNRSNSTTSASSNTGEASTVVISPQTDDGEESFRFHHSLMCFSHHFLSASVGLVCSERGLLHFDIRVPARSQRRGSLIPELSKGGCKSCYPWRLGEESNGGIIDSAYVFAGGSQHAALYDLRMTGSSSVLNNDNQVVQRYTPRGLRNKSVAVSGIDLSKDKRELLVAYESDQIYTFPVLKGKIDPTLDDINEKENDVPESAVYGGHLNRLTFLKAAMYAGPNDEYICTGKSALVLFYDKNSCVQYKVSTTWLFYLTLVCLYSLPLHIICTNICYNLLSFFIINCDNAHLPGSDSGNAFIYEKKSGTVVSLIKADNSTCNGIQPHPYLPFFVTYGIDSTAKLWRATTPVDINVDDSDLGRFRYAQKSKYKKSIVVDEWKKARKGKEVDLEDEDLCFLPDETSEDDNDDSDHFLGMFIRSRFSQQTPYIGNDLMNLPQLVRKNLFTCARSLGMDDDDELPVKSSFASLKQRVSLIKLKHQADSLGLEFNQEKPWILKAKGHLEELCGRESEGSHDLVSYGSLADLIPDNPSDWLPYDKLLANPPQAGGMQFNTKYQLDTEVLEDSDTINKIDTKASAQPHTTQANEKLLDKSQEEEYDTNQAWDILYQTVDLLKRAGNEALKANLPQLATKRYDKAINYCAVAYLRFPIGNINFLAEHRYILYKNGGFEVRWNELLKTLIILRLNIALVYLRPELDDARGATTQTKIALEELKPFTTEKGVVLTGKKFTRKRMDEPLETYIEAKTLESKAYFRLGTAQLVLCEYEDAVESLEQCVESTKEAGKSVDAAVFRKLTEARRCRKMDKERKKKKFKFMFSSNDTDGRDE